MTRHRSRGHGQAPGDHRIRGAGRAKGRRLRVLFIATDLGPGGSERQLLALGMRLPRDRFAPSFVLLRERGIFAPLAEAAGIDVMQLDLKPPSGIGRLWFGVRLVRALFRYVRLARRGRYDLVDAWLYQGYWLAALAYPFAGIRIFVAGRRSLSDFKDRWGRMARAIDVLARRRARVIVANAEIVRQDVIRREAADPGSIIVIRNGVELSAPTDAATRGAARERLGCGEHEFIFGCVSNLKPGKGIEHLLRAFAALPDGRALRLVLVGDGPLRPALSELAGKLGIADRVRFHGTDADPSSLLPAMDVFVHPSDTEGTPNAVLEAAAAGLPIVATAAGGTPEVVLDGRTGILAPIGDVAGLTSALTSLRNDEERRVRFGAAARDHVAALYGMDRFVAETAALYERLVANDVRPGLA